MKVKIRSISPLHIWSGEKYPLFTLKGNKRLNETDILEKFLKEKKIIEKIEKGELHVSKLSEIINFEDIKKFVENYEKFEELYEIDEIDKNILLKFSPNSEILETIKYANLPYIPGSSIKGALVTALFYNEFFNKAVDEIKRNLKRFENPFEIGKIERELGIKRLEVSDCFLKKFKIRIGLLKVGKIKEIPIEVVDEFYGELEVSCDGRCVKEIIDFANNFSRKYLEVLKKLREIEPNTKYLIKNYENRKLIILGKFTNLFSKSLQILFQEKGIKISKKIFYPQTLRVFKINGKRNLIGLVEII